MTAPRTPSGVRFVLVRTRNPLNLGAAARAMANFGLDDLAVVEPFSQAWREARSAVGAAELMRRASQLPLDEALRGCHLILGATAARRRALRQPVVLLPGLRAFLRERLGRTGKAAILFGSEKSGLRNVEFERCHALLHVPTRPDAPSMNLGQAIAVTAYELSRPEGAPRPLEPERELPSQEQLDHLVSQALGAARRVGHLTFLPQRLREEKLRRAFHRWRLSRSDAALIQSFLKRIPAAGGRS